MGTEFQFYKVKSSGDGWYQWLYHSVMYLRPLNCALRNEEGGKFCYVHFSTCFLREVSTKECHLLLAIQALEGKIRNKWRKERR